MSWVQPLGFGSLSWASSVHEEKKVVLFTTCQKFECFAKGRVARFGFYNSVYVMEQRNVCNYVINLAHLKNSAQIYGIKTKQNIMPEYEKDDELL